MGLQGRSDFASLRARRCRERSPAGVGSAGFVPVPTGGGVSGRWSRGALSSAVLRCMRARGSALSPGARGDAPEDRSADAARRPSRVPARVRMPCAKGGKQCDRDPAFEQRQRSARPRGFGGARGVLEKPTLRGAGRRGLALALAVVDAAVVVLELKACAASRVRDSACVLLVGSRGARPRPTTGAHIPA
jgi:hypothetical protein